LLIRTILRGQSRNGKGNSWFHYTRYFVSVTQDNIVDIANWNFFLLVYDDCQAYYSSRIRIVCYVHADLFIELMALSMKHHRLYEDTH
jgi:hypothetical protein